MKNKLKKNKKTKKKYMKNLKPMLNQERLMCRDLILFKNDKKKKTRMNTSDNDSNKFFEGKRLRFLFIDNYDEKCW